MPLPAPPVVSSKVYSVWTLVVSLRATFYRRARSAPSRLRPSRPTRAAPPWAPRRPVVVPVISLAVISVGSRSRPFSRRPGPSRGARTRPPARGRRHTRHERKPAAGRPAGHMVPAHRPPHQARRVARARSTSSGHGGASHGNLGFKRVCGRIPDCRFGISICGTPIPNHVPLVHGGVPRTDCPRGRGRSAAEGSQCQSRVARRLSVRPERGSGTAHGARSGSCIL